MSLTETPEYSFHFQKPLSSAEKVEDLLINLVVSLGYDPIHISQQKNTILTRKSMPSPKVSLWKILFQRDVVIVSRDEVHETIQGYFTILDEKPPLTVSYNFPYNTGYREMGLRFAGAKDQKIKEKIVERIENQTKKFISKNL